jgi:5-methyltetrahydropteroyltriglutamate--homocysteine methyltransferase
MNTLPAQLTGIFARSKELIRATRDFDRKRCSIQELEKVRSEDVKRIIALQKGFEFISDGGLLWQDILRPFTQASGIELGPLARFFETNTFYRRPVIVDKISFDAKTINNFIYLDLLPSNRKVILPGPVTFCGLSENRYYKKGFVIAVAEMLAEEVKHLTRNGVRAVQFSEPYLAYCGAKMSKKDINQAKIAYETIASVGNSIELSIHTYFGDFSAISYIVKFPVDAVAIDLTSTNLKNLKLETDKKIGLGCIDAANSLLENTKDVIKLVRSLVQRLHLKNFYLCPNCGLDFLPYPIAEKKVEILKAAANEFKQA